MSLLSLCDDVLKYELFPYLTIKECVYVNDVLPKAYMVVRKISPVKLLEFELHFLQLHSLKQIKTINRASQELRPAELLKWLGDYKKYAPLFQYDSKSRVAFLKSLAFFADPTQESGQKTPEFLSRVQALREEVGSLEKYPYIMEKKPEHMSGYIASFFWEEEFSIPKPAYA